MPHFQPVDPGAFDGTVPGDVGGTFPLFPRVAGATGISMHLVGKSTQCARRFAPRTPSETSNGR